MDAYDYAMQLEKDGEAFYREGAAGTDNKGLKTILTLLADAEVVHFNIFKKMKEGAPWEMGDATILRDVKNVFVAMKEEGVLKGASGKDLSGPQVDLYRKAQEIEKKTEDFYREKASEVANEAQKAAFLRIAEEEKKHFFILEQIIGFVSRPHQWLENAEFYHLEEY